MVNKYDKEKKRISKNGRTIYYAEDFKISSNLLNQLVLSEKTLFVKPKFKVITNDKLIPSLDLESFSKNLETKSINQVTTPYTPQMITQTYNSVLVSVLQGKKIPKITIIGCYFNPNIQSDFDVWRTRFGLSPKTINQINLGSDTNIASGLNTGWYLEGMLDIQSVYMICPTADIYFIMAKSASFADIKQAITKANQIGSDIVSMSFGATEPSSSFFYTSNSLESVFTSKACCYLASTGDTDYPSYPATSPNVLAVGGTSLYINYNTDSNTYSRKIEQTWENAGTGYSKYFSKPNYQSGIAKINLNKRALADISGVSNPSTGIYVYCSNYQSGGTGWYQVGGTSLSCPLMAGFVGNALIYRFNRSANSLTTVNNSTNSIQNAFYSLYKSNRTLFNSFTYDPTTGLVDNGFNAGIGYDFPTGLGVLNYDLFAQYLGSL